MSDDRLDLRDLSQVDSPEVVSAALAEFRRRMWTRYLWVVAVVAAVGVLAWQMTHPDDLRQRIERAEETSTNDVYAGGSARIGIDKVADLGETVGLHLLVLPEPGSDPGVEPGSGLPGPWLRVDGTVEEERTGGFDRWFEIEPPADGIVRLEVGGPGCRAPAGCPIEIDLRELGVPASTWR
jgi:hypothetical protein